MTSSWSRTYARHGCSSSRRRSARAVRGFTLIEVVVAMAILLVVMIGVLSAISFAYTSSTDTEMRNIATNVASYTLEYLRARTVTRGASGVMASLSMTLSSTGTYGWYAVGTNGGGAFPSMVDVGNLPVQSNGQPCNYSSTKVRTDSTPDGATAGGTVMRFASKHAALPTDKYASTPLAWSTTLQGYASLQNASALGATVSPAPEDTNVARIGLTGDSPATGTYCTLLVGKSTGLIVRYPGVYLATLPALAITSFTPLTGYVPKVYTTDTDTVGLNSKVSPNSQEYDPYYTNVQTGTQLYRGFRVLTQVVARSTAAIDANNFRQVQYYDVTVTVLWMNGTHESNYELVSQIAAY